MSRAVEFPKPESVWTYYARSVRALDELQKTLYRHSRGEGEAPESLAGFTGMTREEVDAELRSMRDELDAEVTLFLVASFEAILRTDFNRRCRAKGKDAPSVALRELSRAASENVRLTDVLDVWKKHTEKPGGISDLKALLHLRHWLAHGRYFTEKSGLRHAEPSMACRIGKRALLPLQNVQTFGLDAI